MNTKKYSSSLCSSIDRLLEAWNTAGKYNYDNIHPNEPGNMANYFAIKLGLTTLDGDLPYNSDKWLREDTIEDTKKKYPKVPADLKAWKQKAKALDSNSELFTLSFETDITKANIEKFLRVAEEAIDLQKHSNEMKFPPHLGNPAVSVKGRILNELALELGLINPNWYLARQCDLGSGLDSKPYDLPVVKEYNLQLYKDLGIDPNCCRFAFIVVDDSFGDGIIDEDRLQALVVKAEALLEDSGCKINAKIEPIPLDEKRFMAFADGKWHKVSPRAVDILRKLNEEPGTAYTGDELKQYPDSSERPDKIIGRLPKPVRVRITNTPQHGYHII